MGSVALLATERLTKHASEENHSNMMDNGRQELKSEVSVMQMMTHAGEGIHSGFETKGRHHKMS